VKLKRYQAFFSLLLVLNIPVLLHTKPNEFLMLEPLGNITEPQTWPGFFACFQAVIGGLDYYEQNEFAGCMVRFKWGLYLDPQLGPDWWEYYFEPIKIGSRKKRKVIHLDNGKRHELAYNAIATISRERACQLIHKYVRIKPHIQEKIDTFVKENFEGNFIIGIHYRGTDKSREAPRVSYEKMHSAIAKTVDALPRSLDYKIFVATDEQLFIDYMKSKFGSKVCCLDAIRSLDGTPLHFKQAQPYRQGEETLMDCILLSTTNMLIRTHSNIGASAGNFNPLLPVATLNTHNASAWYPNIR
jgi:Nodulation protein Z (NodZ)